MRKNKIRILHVAQAAGGVDRYIRMLLKYLDKEKFENILICSQDFHEEDSNHPILLLDEATSALDEATALRLLNNLRKMTDKTVILVTHRMNQAEFFDAELAFSKDGICVRERKTCK